MDKNQSIWEKTAAIPGRRTLTKDLHVDAAVVGGGLAGILTAHYLARAGFHVVVLERGRIGNGQTAGTTAKITLQHGLIYHNLTEQFGEETARRYAQANGQAIEEYARIIREEGIDCDFERCAAYLYTAESANVGFLKQEYKAAEKLGIPAALTTETELPFPVTLALRFEEQAKFHPLKFLRAVAGLLEIYEETAVLRAEGDKLYTKNGIVTARHIVFCCHYPFQIIPGYYFMRMHQERSYVIALTNRDYVQAEGKSTEKEQLGERQAEGKQEQGVELPESLDRVLSGMYLGIDLDGLSFRSDHNFLLLGGGSHRTGENRAGGQFARLREAAQKYYPGLHEAAAWSAQDCMTLDNIPYIGTFSASTPNWYVATGFRKWGMTSSMAAAQLIAGLIQNGSHPWEKVFSPQRFSITASGKKLAQEMVHATKDLSRRVFAPPRAEVDALPKGHGGVVEYEGEKCGVYKDENGEIFAVSIRCPHLGCQLEWNPDAKSWDCPCHGSRFDYRGRLLDGPAQEGIEEKKDKI